MISCQVVCVGVLLIAVELCTSEKTANLQHAEGSQASQIKYLKAVSEAQRDWPNDEEFDPVPVEQIDESRTPRASSEGASALPLVSELPAKRSSGVESEVTIEVGNPTSIGASRDASNVKKHQRRSTNGLPPIRFVHSRPKPEELDQECYGEDCLEDTEEYPEISGRPRLYFIVQSFRDFMRSSMEPHEESPQMVIGVFSKERLNSDDLDVEVVQTPSEETVSDGEIIEDFDENSLTDNTPISYVEEDLEDLEGKRDETMAEILSQPPETMNTEGLLAKISENVPEPEEDQLLLIDPSSDELGEAISLAESSGTERASSRRRRTVGGNVTVFANARGRVWRANRLPSLQNTRFNRRHLRRPVVVYRPVRTLVSYRSTPLWNIRVHPRRVRRRLVRRRVVTRI